MRQQTGCLFKQIWATGLFPLGDGHTWKTKMAFHSAIFARHGPKRDQLVSY